MNIPLAGPEQWGILSLVLTGNDAQVEVSRHFPSPSTSFPSVNIPIEQIATNAIKVIKEDNKDNPNFHLLHSETMSLQDIPGFYLIYSDSTNTQGIESETRTDMIYLLSDGQIYGIIYSVPASLFEQNKDIRDYIFNSVLVGDKYDEVMEAIRGSDDGNPQLQNENNKLLAETQHMIDKANTCAMKRMNSNILETQLDSFGNKLTHYDPYCKETFNGP